MDSRNKLASLLLMLLTFLVSFGFAINHFTGYAPSGCGQYVDDILEKTERLLVKKYPVRVIGTRVAMPSCDVQSMGLEFQMYGPLMKEELRPLLLDCAETLVTHINEHEQIRPYLNHYPFAIKDITVNFFLKDRTGNGLRDPNIGVASVWKGRLEYVIFVEKDGIPKIKEKLNESYADALDAMKQEQEGAA